VCYNVCLLFPSTANSFLSLLAKETGGRYHRCHGKFDAQLFAHKLLTEGFADTEVNILASHEKLMFHIRWDSKFD
jgi:hypothetical protein